VAIKCPACHSENPETLKFCGECGTQLPPPQERAPVMTETLRAPVHELTTGSTFAGRYQVIEELGHGGMGRVYKVLDTKTREKVALKLIKPEIASDKETIERFGNELRLARRIRQKNVCGMYDLGEAEGASFITMEYVHGEDLKSMIQMAAGLTVGAVLNIGKQVCDGLAEAHSLGVVHRDLKPQNIMIDRGGNAKIMDFGIARSLKEKGITGASTMIGTPEYMSPEQAEAKEVDQRSDIYSLGIILYEMATGRVPFEGETALSIAMKHKGEIPKNPKQFNPNIPEDLASVILKCLAKDKDKRYQSAAELHGELDKIEKGLPTTERVVPEKKPVTSREITLQFSPKKLAVPALVIIVLILAALVTWKVFLSKPAPEAIRSIAVLPFVNMSADKEDEYFSDGMTEELINALSKLKGLRVAARTSSFAFKGKTENISKIGQQLRVNTILEGSFRKAGNKLRITAQLINVASGFHLWSETYEREIKDVFVVQDDISRAIVAALKIALTGDQGTQLTKRYTENTEAYQLYLKGRYYWNKRTEEGLKKGVECFEKALEIDSDFALAYAGLADSWIAIGWYRWSVPKEAYAKAKAAATRALEIDSSLAEAHTSLADVKELYDWDWPGAETEYKKAIELNPRYPTAHHWYSLFLVALGRLNEAITEAKQAQEIDPLSLIVNENLGDVLRLAKRYDEAIEQLRKTLDLDPGFGVAHGTLARTYLNRGMLDKAVAEALKAMPLELVPALKEAYMKSGIRGLFEKWLELAVEMSRHTYVSPYDIGGLYAILGKKNDAFAWLEKACTDRSILFTYIRADASFESLRSDPRYTALLKKVGLE
jgi:serine/threonine protein kinase/tetratricopeptide (TPR) repeat protein